MELQKTVPRHQYDRVRKQALIKIFAQKQKKRQDSPLEPAPRTYGIAAQVPTKPDDSPELKLEDKQFIQRVVGIFLITAEQSITLLYMPSVSSPANKQIRPKKRKKK